MNAVSVVHGKEFVLPNLPDGMLKISSASVIRNDEKVDRTSFEITVRTTDHWVGFGFGCNSLFFFFYCI